MELTRITKARITIVAIISALVILIASVAMSNNDNKPKEIASNLDTYERYVQVLTDGSKINVSNKLLETKTYNGLEISNISLKYSGRMTILLADVTNKAAVSKEQQKIYVVLEDEKGKEIERLRGIIDRVEPNETIQLNITVTNDIANAYNLRIEPRQ